MKYDGSTLYLHQSDLNDLRMCPEQARLKLVGEYFDPESDSAYIGTLMHCFIEECLRWKKANGQWPVPKHLEETVRGLKANMANMWPDIWRHPNASNHPESMEHAQALVEQACINWWTNVRPTMDSWDPSQWHIEHEFDHHLTTITHEAAEDLSGYGVQEDGSPGWVVDFNSQVREIEVRLRGSIDFLSLEHGVIMDWKTSKAASGFNLWKLERYDVQSNVYAMGATMEFHQNFKFQYHHMTRGSDRHNMNEVTPTPETIGMVARELISWAEMIVEMGTEQKWPIGPTDWWCSSRWCSHHARGLCAGASNKIMPDDAVYLTDLLPVQ